MERIKYIDHTADIIVECYDKTLEKTFEAAAEALFNIMLNIKKVEPKIEYKIHIEAFDLEELLLRWLEEFLIIFDSESLVFSDFKIHKIEKNDLWILDAICRGEPFDSIKHEFKTGVKAATYAEMQIKHEKDGWMLHFVLDL